MGQLAEDLKTGVDLITSKGLQPLGAKSFHGE
jgi:hypothetical protein